ncbi:MAG: phosphotransacetylase family protein [Candidatus Margulisiibacteriota bacterium]
MKKVFVAATRQNDGKTLTSVGLFHALSQRFAKTAYMKPVGQQYLVIDGKKIDKDVVLFQKIYGLTHPLADMSPIAVPKGFTENYILNPNREHLVQKIKTGYQNLAEHHDCLLIEGTGHAGVGSVFDLSNADVAELLGAKVILVSLGGLGKSIDEILLNKALFDLKGIELVGVIVNKIHPEKYDKIVPLVRQGLERHGIRLLGALPMVNMLSKPSVAELCEDLNATLLCGEVGLNNPIKRFVIGDMLPHDALDTFSPNTILIVPANSEGLIMTALYGNLLESDSSSFVSAIIFTGKADPHEKILSVIRHSKIPVMQVRDDSFTVATKINNMIVKLRAEETEKIKTAQALIEQYVDIETVYNHL